jgi:hypothetical protein
VAKRVAAGRWVWLVVILLVSLATSAAPVVLAQRAQWAGRVDVSPPAESGVLDVGIGTAVQAVRGRVVGRIGDVLRFETATREMLVRPPSDFSAPLDACIQVAGQTPLGPVFQADKASLVPPDERAQACPPSPPDA